MKDAERDEVRDNDINYNKMTMTTYRKIIGLLFLEQSPLKFWFKYHDPCDQKHLVKVTSHISTPFTVSLIYSN